MPFIQNCAESDITSGHHLDPGGNALLISIVDPDCDHPTAKSKFKERHNFKFLDIEKNDYAFDENMRCSQSQANELVQLLQRAFLNDMNVIVHCFAGICRSGAVCELGVIMGFTDVGRFRSPNLLVKHQMMNALGMLYNENENPNIDDWRTFRNE
jgi:predicted protein tyrosine phosphatase